MCIGQILGVRITLNWWFLLLLLLLAVVGLLPEAIIVFGVVMVHELAHVAVAKGCGMHLLELELLPFGGVARVDDLMEMDPAVEMKVAVAGPLSNLFLIGVGLVCHTYEVCPQQWLDFFLRTNVALAAFNALPALPLDGGRCYRAMLTRRLGFRRATHRAASLGKVFAVLFAMGGLAGAYLGYINVTLIILGFFVYAAAAKEQKTAMYVLMRYLARKQEELARKGCLASEQLVATEHTTVGDVVKLFVPQRYHLVWVVDEKGRVQGLVTELDLIDAMFEQGTDTLVKAVMQQ